MRADSSHWSRIAGVLTIFVGILLVLVGTTGLGLALSEYFWPNARPLRSTMDRIGDQIPNLILMLTMPVGFVLLRQGQDAFRQP